MKIFQILVLISIGIAANAQPKSTKSMEPIMKIGMDLVHQIESKYEGIVALRAEFDYALDDNYTYIDLVKGLDYIIASVADDRIKAISLMAYKKNGAEWDLIAKEDKGNPFSILEFKPEESGEYAFDVHVNKFASKEKIGHVAIMVFAQRKLTH